MSIKTVLKNIETARKAYRAQLEQAGAQEIAKELGDLIPAGYGVAWTQYTPFFNDGDACTFSVNEASIVRLKGTKIDDSFLEDGGMELANAVTRYGKPDKTESYTGGSYVVHGFPAIDGFSKESMAALRDAVHSLLKDDDLMLEVFGDHVSVLIRHDGVYKTSEYDHD